MKLLIPSIAAFFFVVSPLVTCSAQAGPKVITFENLIKGSPTIIVAKLPEKQVGGKKDTISLEVLRILRGTLKPGIHEVKYGDLPFVKDDVVEFVAFLDEKQVWRFIAAPVGDSKKVERSVLKLEGFYDFNAYLVSHGLISEAQLKTYLKNGTLTYRFRGPVYFPQRGKADWKASSLNIKGTYDAVKGNVSVSGLPSSKGFPVQPKVYVASFLKETIHLEYSRELHRPLELIGDVKGLEEKTGEILVQFAVTAPEILTEKTLKDYLADGRNGACFNSFQLKCSPLGKDVVPKAMTLVFGRWGDGDWHSIQLDGWEKGAVTILAVDCHGRGLDSSEQRFLPGKDPFPKVIKEGLEKKDGVLRMAAKARDGNALLLSFNLGRPLRGDLPFTWHSRSDWPYVLFSSEVTGTLSISDGKAVRNIADFTVSHDSVGFNRLKEK